MCWPGSVFLTALSHLKCCRGLGESVSHQRCKTYTITISLPRAYRLLLKFYYLGQEGRKDTLLALQLTPFSIPGITSDCCYPTNSKKEKDKENSQPIKTPRKLQGANPSERTARRRRAAPARGWEGGCGAGVPLTGLFRWQGSPPAAGG